MLGLSAVLYFVSLMMFCFVSHPVIYCLLLLVSSLVVCSMIYFIMGFSWYLLLFGLVYVGGTYVLFVYASFHESNSVLSLSVSFWGFLFLFSFFFWGLFSFFDIGVGFVENSYYLCGFFEGFSYCLFCLVLLVGFSYISVILGCKDSFFR
uniref:NADH dehydrogenase subunit 6 n=1 Tax=Eurytrema pancreaticum TaxID=374591 RepID=A0A0E3U341_EUTPN|nr:NADH dehydrogenase subunit 6 [Eurytrema pancreaticum]